PWTFTRAVDSSLDPRRSWRRLLTLPRLVHVRSAGSPRGMETGYDDLLATAESDPRIAAKLMPGAGLAAEHVPWLVRTGVRAFHVGPQVRPGGSGKAYVDAGYVRSWRALLDDAMERLGEWARDRHRPARRAPLRPDVVAPRQRHVVRRAARLRRRPRYPPAWVRPRPLRRTVGVLRRGGRRRCRAGQLARPGGDARARRAAPPQERPHPRRRDRGGLMRGRDNKPETVDRWERKDWWGV